MAVATNRVSNIEALVQQAIDSNTDLVSNPETAQAAHGFSAGQVLYNNAGTWVLALNTGTTTLAYYMVAEVVDANTFRLAVPGQVVNGFAGLTPGAWYHCSATTPGAIEAVGTLDDKLSGATAANPIAQAISATQVVVFSLDPYVV